jgi:hypothetical protein
MNTTEQMMTTSDTIRDANETLSKSLIFILWYTIKRTISILDSQGRLQQSTLISESEFIKINTSSSTSADDEHTTSAYRKTIKVQYCSISCFFSYL